MSAIHHSALAAVCAFSATSAGCISNAHLAKLPSGSPAMAITTAAVALATTAAVGCNFQGCPYGSFCNTETKRCIERTCEQGCPTNTVCNEGLHLCQAPSLALTPNDFLPEDRPAMQDDGSTQRWWFGGL